MKSYKHKQVVLASGLEKYTVNELSYYVLEFLYDKVNYVDDDFKVTQLLIAGSRLKGNHRKNSDVDVAFLYEGRYRSDSMCDTLNMDPLIMDDIRVDFIPLAKYKGETIHNSRAIQHLPIPI